jgi:hypothetical protein
MTIPTLAELIGDGQRGDGWEGLEHATRQYLGSTDTHHRELTRFIRLFTVAAIEGARQSTAAGTSYAETIMEMSRAAGYAVACAATSATDHDDLERLTDLGPIVAGIVADAIKNFICLQVRAALSDIQGE